ALAEERIAHRLMDHAEPAGSVVHRVAPAADRPAGARRIMVAQVFPHPRQGAPHLDAELFEPLRIADARQLQLLRRVDRAGADYDLARTGRLALLAPDRISDARAARAVEHDPFAQCVGLDMQVLATANGIEIGARGADAAALGDRRLAHHDAVLLGAVVVAVVADADLARRLDQRLEDRVRGRRIGDPERPVAPAEPVVAAALVAFHALEEGQHLLIAPALVAHLRPGVEVLRLAAHKGHAVQRARPAEHLAARHRNPAAV